jgi:uncharacterized protein with FMN-binding domain
MRRLLLAIVVTTLGLVLLLSYKTPGAPWAAERPAAFASPFAEPPTSTTHRTATRRATTHRSTTTRAPTTTARTTATSGAAARTTTSTTRAASVTRQATGQVVRNEYGPVQVRVTVRGTRIVDVAALQLPSAEQRSRELSARAAPLLRQRVLAAQSAQIDAVSGATFTSGSYVRSLQAALDSL